MPYKIPQLNQSHTGQELALLLSCPPFLPPDYSPKTRWSSLAQNAFLQNPGQFCRENGCPDGRCQIDKSAPITQPSDLSLRRDSMTLRHCFSEDIFIGTDAATPRISSSVGESSFRDWPQPLNCSQSWPRPMPRPCNTSPKHPSTSPARPVGPACRDRLCGDRPLAPRRAPCAPAPLPPRHRESLRLRPNR